MKLVFCIISIGLSTLFCVGFSQCKTELMSLFDSYKISVRSFDVGVNVFNMKFTQETTYNDGENDVTIQSKVNVVSDGIVKYLESNGTRVCSDSIFQALIDDKKKTITIGVVNDYSSQLESNFSFLDSLFGKNVRITCADSGNSISSSFWITPNKVEPNSGVQRSLIVLSKDHSKMIAYRVEYGVNDPVKMINMDFHTLEFNCKTCYFPESVWSLLFDSKGELRIEYSAYSLIDLRQ